MNRIRLVIVDDDRIYSEQVAEFMSHSQEIEVVGCANDGFEAGRLIMRECPDVVVMGLVLRRINALSLLRSIRAFANRPSLIVCSAFLSDTSMNMARTLGVDFFLGKPASLPHLLECIVETVIMHKKLEDEKRTIDAMAPAVSVTANVHRALVESGISPRVSGFSFLVEGLNLLLSDASLLKNVSQRLYPKIASSMNATPAAVERNIRSAIRSASKKRGSDTMAPSNRQFIAALYRKVQEKRYSSLG